MINKIKLSFLFIFIFSVAIIAQQKVLNEYNIFDLKNVSESTISSDGKFVAYTVSVNRSFTDDKFGNNYSELHVYDIAKKESKGIATGKINISQIQWHPKENKIFFRATLDENKIPQVYQTGIEKFEPTVLTTAPRGINNYQICPTGTKIFFVSNETKDERKNELKKKGFDAEIYEEDFDHLTLYYQDLNSKEIKKITDDVTVFEFRVSPDGKKILAQIADKNLVDYSMMFKELYVIDVATAKSQMILDVAGKISDMAWSPDAKNITFVAAADTFDSVSGSLFIISSDNKKTWREIRNYTKGFIGSVKDVDWLASDVVLFYSEEGVYHTIRTQKINGDKSEILLQPGKVIITSMDFLGDNIILSANTKAHPNEIYHFQITNKKLDRLTNVNPWLSEVRLAKQEKIVYKARDGLEIEAVLFYPLDFVEGKRYPMIASIHGGPEACFSDGWNTNYGNWGQIAAAQGYFVFLPNYRASSGRGVEFSMMGREDLVGGEFEDVLDGIDYLVNKGWVDKNRVGIGGGSYGGYFSAWGATRHTERFAAAVTFVGVSNQISKANTTDIPWEDYFVHWGKWPHEDFMDYLNRSPIAFSHQSKTPTLILHGKEDPRVHPAQSLELYRTLKLHSEAPVRLVLYPGEGHGNRKNTSRLDYVVRTMEWFNFYLKGNNDRNTMPDKYLNFEFN